MRILINHCTKMWRHNKKTVHYPDNCETGQAGGMDHDRAYVEFKQLLLSLPKDSRTIFQLYYGEQFTTREIAAVLGMKENTVKSRLHRGKEQLREQLQ